MYICCLISVTFLRKKVTKKPRPTWTSFGRAPEIPACRTSARAGTDGGRDYGPISGRNPDWASVLLWLRLWERYCGRGCKMLSNLSTVPPCSLFLCVLCSFVFFAWKSMFPAGRFDWVLVLRWIQQQHPDAFTGNLATPEYLQSLVVFAMPPAKPGGGNKTPKEKMIFCPLNKSLVLKHWNLSFQGLMFCSRTWFT